MAKITVEDLSLEIAYTFFEDGWVYYDIWYRWRDEPIINDAILKRHNDHWAKRGKGAIKACEHRGCEILPLIRDVLKTNKSDYWEATDPDVLLALYTGDTFPFLPSKWTLIYEKPETKAKREAQETERAASGPLPGDYIEIILSVDAYTFAGSTAYYGDGICFRLTVTREMLDAFYEDLKIEYIAFRNENGIETFNCEDLGPDYTPPEL
jgi:hypothetical protein